MGLPWIHRMANEAAADLPGGGKPGYFSEVAQEAG